MLSMMAFKTAHFGAEPVEARKSVPKKFGPHFLLKNAYKNVVQNSVFADYGRDVLDDGVQNGTFRHRGGRDGKKCPQKT